MKSFAFNTPVIKSAVKTFTIAVNIAIVFTFADGANAALEAGAAAPMFNAPATLGGKEFEFSLADSLKKGPTVVYFYPAAFTKGCTVEAHMFAEAVEQYHALGASVIGVSADNIDVLNKFSVSECQSKFPVASDAAKTITKSYEAVFMLSMPNRTSYVITPDGKVLYSFSALSPEKHVANTLDALKQWKAKQK